MRVANVKHSSASAEHMTPAGVVESARSVLGSIDLDPASTTFANQIVRAKRIYTKHDDGLSKQWRGRVFLNPPGGTLDAAVRGTRSSQVLWWAKLVEEWESERVTSAIFVGFSLELLQAVQQIDVPHPLDFPCCIPKRRIKFDTLENGRRVSGNQPTHSNVIVWLPACLGPDHKQIFSGAFRRHGFVTRFVSVKGSRL